MSMLLNRGVEWGCNKKCGPKARIKLSLIYVIDLDACICILSTALGCFKNGVTVTINFQCVGII